jgi:hypothetical protein
MVDKILIRNVYQNPAENTVIPLAELVERSVDAYLIISCSRTQIRSYVEHSAMRNNRVEILNFAVRNCPSEKEKIDILATRWNKLCESFTAEEENNKTYLIFMPRIDSYGMVADLFYQMRQDISDWQERNRHNKTRKRNVIFIGDHWTLKIMGEEIHINSKLSFVFKDEIWSLESVASNNAIVSWLSGGNYELTSHFEERLEPKDKINPSALCARIRVLAHRVAAELLHPPMQFFMQNRLRSIAHSEQHGLNAQEKQERLGRVDKMQKNLASFLPGSYSIHGKNSPMDWNQQKQNARWRPYTLLPETLRDLLMGGILRCDERDGKPILRISSPLLGYAISRYSMENRLWQPGSERIRKALEQESLDHPPPEPAGLDYYLDAWLDKASGVDDGEMDHWAAGSIVIKPGRAQGYWWERFGYGEGTLDVAPGYWWKRFDNEDIKNPEAERAKTNKENLAKELKTLEELRHRLEREKIIENRPEEKFRLEKKLEELKEQIKAKEQEIARLE